MLLACKQAVIALLLRTQLDCDLRQRSMAVVFVGCIMALVLLLLPLLLLPLILPDLVALEGLHEVR